jgi:LacI family sucrose operon transcriptional repressor
MATIKDVARESGLAVGTVSRILNNRGYISDKSRKKVKEAMIKLDYKPNETARSLKRKSTSLIGVIVPQIAHPYFSSLISCLEETAYRQDYRIMLLNSQGDPRKENQFIDLCYRYQVAGIVLCNGNMDIIKPDTLSVPVVTIERKMEGGDASIECDNEEGGRLAAEHLIDRGCRHLLHISGFTYADMPAEKRGKGFCDVCREKGIHAELISLPFTNYRLPDAPHVFEKILEEHPLVDGIFTSDDIMAAELLYICLKKGIKVPDEMKIVGFDDSGISGLYYPAVTTIRQPVDKMAEQAVASIMGLVDKKKVEKRTVLPVKLVVRETT